jgi:hypothetical protein
LYALHHLVCLNAFTSFLYVRLGHDVRTGLPCNIPGLQQKVQSLPCVTRILRTVGRTHCDDSVFENAVLKCNLFALFEHESEFIGIVRAEGDLFFTER